MLTLLLNHLKFIENYGFQKRKRVNKASKSDFNHSKNEKQMKIEKKIVKKENFKNLQAK